MKNILFYTENFCDASAKGGLEVATFRIAKALKDSGKYVIFHAFRSKSPGNYKSIYHNVIKLGKSDHTFEAHLRKFISENEIDIVVNMSRFFRHKYIVKAVRNSGREVQIFFMQHFAPGSEMKKPTFAAGRHLLRLNPFNPLYWVRASIYPLLRLPRLKKYHKIYRNTYENSDKVILLSDGYKRNYQQIAKFTDESKFYSIPNIYEPPDISLPFSKKKRVLILSRMDEIQKRISLALLIWQHIEKDQEFNDWHLDIVGSGHNTDILKRLIKKFRLKNITYHGWQPREKFLEESAILMTTSEYEGLPLSILEAQAYGTVPIAFDSYASLRDVVEDGVNGSIIDTFGDIESYIKALKLLMKDKDKRTRMAENAQSASRRFSTEIIAPKWLNLING